MLVPARINYRLKYIVLLLFCVGLVQPWPGMQTAYHQLSPRLGEGQAC
jgi:hypothetical protein